jgi:DNA-directed RNA polymerase subunit RPC12/RpoP
VRRLTAAVFVVGVGLMVTVPAIIVLNAVAMWVFGLTWRRHDLLWLVPIVGLLCGGAFSWTWVYMESRYAATAGRMCPHCGYARDGLTADRCPECGSEV